MQSELLNVDSEIIFEAVKQEEYALKHAAPEQTVGREVVLEAVRQDVDAPSHTAPKHKEESVL